MFLTSFPCFVVLLVSISGRPVWRLMYLAQFIGTKGWASSTSPVPRSNVYAKPFRSK